MALFDYISPNIQITPTPVEGTQVAITHDSSTLQNMGFNMQILVTEFLPKSSKAIPKSAVIMGHFDTGARTTSIDIKLACILGLIPS